MASEIRVDKINSLSGVGTVTLSPTGVDIAGITTAATLKATTGIVTTLTATTGIVTTFEATTGDITTLRTPTGIATHFTADKISLPDSSDGSINIGIGSDLIIYHDGNNSFIKNSTGNLRIQDTNGNIQIQAKAGEDSIIAKTDGAVELYNDDTKRLSTTGNGVDIFGSGTTNNVVKLINTSGTSNASHHMTLDTYNASGYWSDLKIDASNIQLNTYTGNRATLSNSALTFASGVNIAMASGNGISFAATGGGSNTSNESELFSDYEQGSCAILIHDAVGSNISVTGGNHKYTRMGNKVFVEGYFTFAESGTKNGGLMQLYQLPFTPAQVNAAGGTYWYDGPSDATDVTGLVYVHTNGTCYLKQSTTQGQNSNYKYLTFNEIAANSNRTLFVSFHYTV